MAQKVKKSVDEVLYALRICGPDYTPDSCQRCPYYGECCGDNAPLLIDARETIDTLGAMAAVAAVQTVHFTEFVRQGGITCYVVKSRCNGREMKYWIEPHRFRVSDLEKLGETVFLREAEAKRKIWRLRNGDK